jgi:hypothetical protein
MNRTGARVRFPQLEPLEVDPALGNMGVSHGRRMTRWQLQLPMCVCVSQAADVPDSEVQKTARVPPLRASMTTTYLYMCVSDTGMSRAGRNCRDRGPENSMPDKPEPSKD